MDLIKKLTGKNPDEYNLVAKNLVNNSDVQLFSKLVKQDDFLFDYIKNNVAKRIFSACNENNYKNILNFFKYYSCSYDDMFADVLYKYGGESIITAIKTLFYDGDNAQKAYAIKCLLRFSNEKLYDLINKIREYTKSDFEPLAINSIELLSKLNDSESKNNALNSLNSTDEFEQFNAIKFLVTYQAKDSIDLIIEKMKKSTLSENIAAEIPYLIPLEELLTINFDAGILVLCNIVNAIPEIIAPSAVIDYNLFAIIENLYFNNFSSSVAVLLRLAKEKFAQLTENDEYLFDCDKNTKDEVFAINSFLKSVNINKINNMLYEELYDESDFVFFAVDFVEEINELESLLDSTNQTLILKVLSLLKEKQLLNNAHKQNALKNISCEHIRNIVEIL